MKSNPVSFLLLTAAVGWSGLIHPAAGRELRGSLETNANSEREAFQGDGPNGDGPRPFLNDDELPPGLRGNPSKAVGVEFKPGRKPKVQKTPKIKKGGQPKIRGLDNKTIRLDIEGAERVNIFSPEHYQASADGTYVTHKKTGEVIPLTVFYREDKNNNARIFFQANEEGELKYVRVAPNYKEGPQVKSSNGKGKPQEVPAQHFLRLDSSDLLVGYYDDDMDLSKIPASGELDAAGQLPIPDDLPLPKNQGNRRRTQAATFPRTYFGKTCNKWDYLDIAITVDKAFTDKYFIFSGMVVEAIVAEAAEMYWTESCVKLYIVQLESTATIQNWWESYPQYNKVSGCNGFGALQLFSQENDYYHDNVNRDAWHMFTAIDFQDGPIGCAWVDACASKSRGYGVNQITFTNDLRLRAVLFAHELGHNMGLKHVSTTNKWWVMEKYVNPAKYDFNPTRASQLRDKLHNSNVCGYFGDPNV